MTHLALKPTSSLATLGGAFLREIDEQITETVQLQWLGGFAVAQCYGLGRETSDVDCIVVIGLKPIAFAGLGSELYKNTGCICSMSPS